MPTDFLSVLGPVNYAYCYFLIPLTGWPNLTYKKDVPIFYNFTSNLADIFSFGFILCSRELMTFQLTDFHGITNSRQQKLVVHTAGKLILAKTYHRIPISTSHVTSEQN